jgi:hypothetical protein
MGYSSNIQDGGRLVYNAELLRKFNTYERIDRVCKRRLYYFGLLRICSAPQSIDVVTSDRKICPYDREHFVNSKNLIKIRIQKIDNMPRNKAVYPSLLLVNAHTQGLRSTIKMAELRHTSVELSPSIVCVTESWLSDEVTDVKLDNYEDYPCNRTGRDGGGVMTYVNSDFKVKTLKFVSSSTYSASFLLLRRKRMNNIILATCYVPPNLKVNDKEAFEDVFLNLLVDLVGKNKSAKLLICGDFNDLDMTNIASTFNLLQLVTFSTRKEAILDLIFTDMPFYNETIEKLQPLSTCDHNMVFLNHPTIKPKYSRITRRSYKEKDKVVDSLCNQNWDDVYNCHSVDEKAAKFNDILTLTLDQYCPLKTRKARDKEPAWLTEEIIEMMNIRNRHYKKGNWLTWRYWRNMIVKKMKTSKRKFVEDEINKKERNAKDWWTTVDALSGQVKHDTFETGQLLLDDEWLVDKDIATEVNKFFINIGGDPTPYEKPVVLDGCSELSMPLVNSYDVLKKLKDVKANKASKDIPSWMLRDCRFYITDILTHIINTMLLEKKFPELWKSAEVRPLEKSKPLCSKTQLRPISILNCTGKIAEKVICDYYKTEANISNNQYAYVPNSGTTVALIKMLDDWTRILDEKDTLGVRIMLVDMSKAFDRMDHHILRKKQAGKGMNRNLIELCSNFLSDRNQYVSYKGFVSDRLPLVIGVPQGSVLGPWLWLTYIDDLATSGTTHKYSDDVTTHQPIRKKHIELSYTTDDDELYVDLHEKDDVLQRSLKQINKWTDDNNMTISKEKTKLMTVQLPHTKKVKCEKIGDLIEVENEKILGLCVDSRLVFTKQVAEVVLKCRRRLHWLRVLKANGVNRDHLRTLYLSKIRSVLTYACEAWYHFLSNTQKEKLEKVQKIALKYIEPEFTNYEEALKNCAVPSIGEFVTGQCISLFKKVSKNKNHKLHNCLPAKRTRLVRNCTSEYVTERCRTEKRKNSFFPAVAALL